MSLADLKTFVKKCANEKAIGEKAKKIGTTNTDGLIKYAGELGLKITEADLESLKKATASGDALTDDQLATISGGDEGIPMTEEERIRLEKALKEAANPSHW